MYVRGGGLLHRPLGISSAKDLLGHPKMGASWDGLVIEQALVAERHEAFFWATQQGAEMDLVLRRDDELYGVECKCADAPKVTKSIRIAMADLGLKQVAVIHPGDRRYPLAEGVEAVPASELAKRGRLFPEG